MKTSVRTFFGVTDLPPPDVAKDALTAQVVTTTTDYWTSHMHLHMDNMTDPDDREYGNIDFVAQLFNVVRYLNVKQNRFFMFKPKLRYLANQGRPPQVDVCIRDDTRAILLVVKVDRHLRGSDPELQLISDAIAAFHNDSIMRVKRLGTNPLTSKVMPGIVMDGTMPTFYKIPITPKLVTAVESGGQPEEETIVCAYRTVPRGRYEAVGQLSHYPLML